MDTWLIVVLVIAAFLLLLAIGGYLANRRRAQATERSFDRRLREVNEQLAEAHAEDRGWERAALERTARQAYAEHRPGVEARDMTLVQVIDRPGTDEDKAVFRFSAGGREEHLTLGRRDGAWVYESLS